MLAIERRVLAGLLDEHSILTGDDVARRFHSSDGMSRFVAANSASLRRPQASDPSR